MALHILNTPGREPQRKVRLSQTGRLRLGVGLEGEPATRVSKPDTRKYTVDRVPARHGIGVAVDEILDRRARHDDSITMVVLPNISKPPTC